MKSTSIAEEVFPLPLVDHRSQHIDFGDRVQVVEVNPFEWKTDN